MTKKKQYHLISRLILAALGLWLLAACGGAPDETDMQATIDAAVQATAVAMTSANTPALATWTPIPIVNEATPTPAATQPPPPTSTPLPTATAEPTEAASPVPTDTPAPTETAVPPTATLSPTHPPQTTVPPPPPPAGPTAPPSPVSGNLAVHPSFEGGWYNMYGIPELQLPNGWAFEWDEGPTGFGNQPWDVWVRPETRVLPYFQLPEGERDYFILDGEYTIKIFKGNGAISFRLFQELNLAPGTYLFRARVYPDLVADYQNGQKIFASDPLAGEIRFIAPGGGTAWFPVPAFGTWNTLEHTFTITEPQTVYYGIGVRGRYALANDGWFFDNWELLKLE